jgi:phosphotriesterase-related protein
VSAHEHVGVFGGLGPLREADFRLDDVERIVHDVTAFRGSGGGALVDAMPLVEGRLASALVDIARRTGVHIVACTGFHRLAYYLDTSWVRRYGAERLAELLVEEIALGMDEHCFCDPDRERSPARAGVIKLATELHFVPAAAVRHYEAAAIAHARTGVPILVHLEQGTAAHEVLDRLGDSGVPASSVLLSHMDRNPDLVLHEEVAARGPFLGYDWLARIKERPDSVMADLIAAMVERGHAGRITLAMDLVRRTYWPAWGGGPGIAHLFGEFVPRLARSGIPESALEAMCVTNPARWLAFTPRGDALRGDP